MEKIRASYEISESAAILAGKSKYGKIIFDVDPSCLTPEQREELISCPKSGGIFQLDGPVDSRISPNDPPYPVFVERDPDIVVALLDHRRLIRLERREQAAEEIKKIAYQLSDSAAWIARAEAPLMREVFPDIDNDLDAIEGVLMHRRVPGSYLRVLEPQNVPWYLKEQVFALVDAESMLKQAREIVESSNRSELDKARLDCEERVKWLRAEQLAESEKASRRLAQISDWVAEHGSENQKKRFSVGLLAEDEVLDGIRSHAFAPIADFAKYRKLQGAEFCKCEIGNPEFDFEVKNSESATAEDFEFMMQIQALLPLATLTLRSHIGKCTQCYATACRKSLRVELTVGEFDFSRELAIREEQI